MPLCQMCKAIPPSLFEGSMTNFHVHHPSLKSLEASTKDDCNICTLFHHTIVNARYKYASRCGGTAGPDFAEQLESTYTYTGLPQNVASKDGHRTYLQISKYKEKKTDDDWVYVLTYQVGRRGFKHTFDVEFSDDANSTTLHPLSEVTFSRARSWIEKCLIGHENCNIRYDTKFIPTRLIDVGKHGTTPRLLETTTCVLEDSRYLALSHRWGSSMPECATTKKGTLAKRLSHIPMKTLPNTFRDAITATRRFGLKYIWIDSLCVLQDSPEDWERESALMGKVYSHSHCMIAATAASNCFGGLFSKHTELPMFNAPNEMGDCSILRSALIKPIFESWDELYVTSKLNGRGWTLQERELSPRIIYFTKHAMLFECREARASDVRRFQFKDWSSQKDLTPKTSLVIDRKVRRCLDQYLQKSIKLSRPEVNLERHYTAWMEMIEGYSTRELSVPSDKFAGVSGLASEFAYLLDDEYVAGLWRKDIWRGLCWRWNSDSTFHSPEMKKLKTQAMEYGPSWSWGKMSVPISYEPALDWQLEDLTYSDFNFKWGDWGEWDWVNRHQGAPSLLSISTVPEGKDPNGSLISATIHLQGAVFRVGRSKTGNFQILGEPVHVFWDHLPQTATAYYVLNLGGPTASVGLVLVPTELKQNEYRRVGIIPKAKLGWLKHAYLLRLSLV